MEDRKVLIGNRWRNVNDTIAAMASSADHPVIYVTRDLRFCVLPCPVGPTIRLNEGSPQGRDSSVSARLLTWDLWREIERETLKMEDLYLSGELRPVPPPSKTKGIGIGDIMPDPEPPRPVVSEDEYRMMCGRMKELRRNLA